MYEKPNKPSGNVCSDIIFSRIYNHLNALNIYYRKFDEFFSGMHYQAAFYYFQPGYFSRFYPIENHNSLTGLR